MPSRKKAAPSALKRRHTACFVAVSISITARSALRSISIEGWELRAFFSSLRSRCAASIARFSAASSSRVNSSNSLYFAVHDTAIGSSCAGRSVWCQALDGLSNGN